MKVILRENHLVLIPEGGDDIDELAKWKSALRSDAFAIARSGGEGCVIASLGQKDEVCREPVSINSRVNNPQWKLITNFAHAPFIMDGRNYANVEGFWQGLKFDSEAERFRIGMLTGSEARRAGQERGYPERIHYEGQAIIPGTWDHWLLMEKACCAKFNQDAAAKAALLSTGNRPIEHRMRRDSRAIPGVIMVDIWMRIRHQLTAGVAATPMLSSIPDVLRRIEDPIVIEHHAIDLYVKAYANFPMKVREYLGGGCDSIALLMEDGNVLKVTNKTLRTVFGNRSFDMPVLSRGKIIVHARLTLEYFIQPKSTGTVSDAEARAFANDLESSGYIARDCGAHQLGRHKGQIKLLDPFGVQGSPW